MGYYYVSSESAAAGCLIYIILIAVAIALVIIAVVAAAFFVLVAISIIVAIMTICGAIYGAYRGLLCYATAVKRTYGDDDSYEPGAGMKTLVIFSILFIFIASVVVYLFYSGVDITDFDAVSDYFVELFSRLEAAIR